MSLGARSLSFALLPLGACTEHLLIGALDDGAAPEMVPAVMPDAAPAGALDAGFADHALPREDAVDAAITSSDGGPLEIALRMFGRDDVISANGVCGAPCTEIEVITRGGRPPYTVTWGDGVLGARRQMCPGTGYALPFAEVVHVDDSSPEPQSQGLMTVLPLQQGCEEAGVEQNPVWQLCIEAPTLNTLDCGPDGGSWYGLRAPLQEASVDVSVDFTVPLLGAATVRIEAAAEPCGARTSLTGGDINGFGASFYAPHDARSTPLRWLVVRAPSEAGGKLPASFAPSFSICFTR